MTLGVTKGLTIHLRCIINIKANTLLITTHIFETKRGADCYITILVCALNATLWMPQVRSVCAAKIG